MHLYGHEWRLYSKLGTAVDNGNRHPFSACEKICCARDLAFRRCSGSSCIQYTLRLLVSSLRLAPAGLARRFAPGGTRPLFARDDFFTSSQS
ncbi:MAG: hypothetical protein ACREYE_05205 [Gammaproteobacteria bacterium]